MTKYSENELYKKLLRVYFDNANDGVFLLCDTMRFYAVNRRLESWLGVEERELFAGRERAVITEFLRAQDDRERFQHHLDRVLKGDPQYFECEIHPDGLPVRGLEISLHRVDLEEGAFVIGVARDVTERRLLLEQLHQHALQDELTGLANRRAFMQQLELLLEDARATGGTHVLVYVDLDHFKVINDTSGHPVGDQCLLFVTDLLQRELNEDATLARLGGDEFGILLRNHSPEQARPVTEALRKTLTDHPFHWRDRTFRISASIGYTAIDAKRAGSAEVMSFADAACYVIKDQGRNGVMEYFGGTRCTGKRDEMGWAARIHEALEENRFVLYHQRIEPMAGEGQRHHEVLLRMLDREGGLVPPGTFIPAAERYNLMADVDRWVVDTLFAQLAEQPGGEDVIWTLNLSGESVSDREFLERLYRRLADPAIPAERICFEFTETTVITNLAQAQAFIQRVRRLGCRVALDDFGSGMSSFAYLKNLAVDYVKIDGSLIVNIETSSADRSIIQAINDISHTLGMKTIAEFVENDAILEVLREIGVDYVQGYGIHRPEPLVFPVSVKEICVTS